jgi:hypothetical protein
MTGWPCRYRTLTVADARPKDDARAPHIPMNQRVLIANDQGHDLWQAFALIEFDVPILPLLVGEEEDCDARSIRRRRLGYRCINSFPASALSVGT